MWELELDEEELEALLTVIGKELDQVGLDEDYRGNLAMVEQRLLEIRGRE